MNSNIYAINSEIVYNKTILNLDFKHISITMSIDQLVLIVISHIHCSLGYNPLNRINNCHKCAFIGLVLNVYNIIVNIT